MTLREIFAKLFETLRPQAQADLVSPLASDSLENLSQRLNFKEEEEKKKKYENAHVHPDDAFVFQGQAYQTSPNAEEFRQPLPEIAGILREYFPNEATQSAVVAMSESDYNPEAVNINPNGSIDTGLFQINSSTFKDFMNRHKNELAEYGITDYSQMKNPILNAAMAKIIRDEQGWDAWYGPANKGYDVTQNLNQSDLADYIKM